MSLSSLHLHVNFVTIYFFLCNIVEQIEKHAECVKNKIVNSCVYSSPVQSNQWLVFPKFIEGLWVERNPTEIQRANYHTHAKWIRLLQLQTD